MALAHLLLGTRAVVGAPLVVAAFAFAFTFAATRCVLALVLALVVTVREGVVHTVSLVLPRVREDVAIGIAHGRRQLVV